jgi:hypothetical protein
LYFTYRPRIDSGGDVIQFGKRADAANTAKVDAIPAVNRHVPAKLQSYIDEPSSTHISGVLTRIQGWCFDTDGRTILGVRARTAIKIFDGTYGLSRIDVQKALGGPPASAQSGFNISLIVIPGFRRVSLEADVAGDGWQEFARISFRSQWTSTPTSIYRLTRFAAGAPFGRRSAWQRLNKDEQNYILSYIHKHASMPMTVTPHHHPRPVQRERFPTLKLPQCRLPQITVVTPSYQQGEFLEATLQSVIQQEGVQLHYIVQDGASTDGSLEILRRHSARLKHWASEPDLGQADAILRGFDHMHCEPDDVMAYLNSDDLLMPGSLRFVAEYFARHPEVDVVYGHRVLIDENGFEVGRWITPRISPEDLQLNDTVPQETMFWRKRIWDRVGGIDPSFQFALDWDLILRFLEAGARFARLPWFLGMFRLHQRQKTQAWLHEFGIPEMNRLRLRSLGRIPSGSELAASMHYAQVDSSLLAAFMRRGWRL